MQKWRSLQKETGKMGDSRRLSFQYPDRFRLLFCFYAARFKRICPNEIHRRHIWDRDASLTSINVHCYDFAQIMACFVPKNINVTWNDDNKRHIQHTNRNTSSINCCSNKRKYFVSTNEHGMRSLTANRNRTHAYLAGGTLPRFSKSMRTLSPTWR